MIASLAALLAFAPAQMHSELLRPIPNYRPAKLPAALNGADLRFAGVEMGSFRGYGMTRSIWWIKKPFSVVVRQCAKDMKPDGRFDPDSDDKSLMNGPPLHFSLLLPDRSIGAFVLEGREVAFSEGLHSHGWKFADESCYTQVRLTEKPLSVGPLPEVWPKEARIGESLPAKWPGPPFQELPRAPDAWTRTGKLNAGGGMMFWAYWFVHERPDSLIPRLSALMQKRPGWRVSGDTLSCMSTDPKEPWLHVFFQKGAGIGSSKEWTTVSCSWTGPDPDKAAKRGG